MKTPIYTGEDKAITLSLTDDSGKPINLDELTDVILYILTGNRRVLRVAKTGDNIWVPVDAFTYRYVIDSSITKTFAPGDYYAEINVVSASGLVVDNKLNSIGREPFFAVTRSYVGNES